MIVFFAVLGIASKMKIPEAHTLLEIVRIRYGKSCRECLMPSILRNYSSTPQQRSRSH